MAYFPNGSAGEHLDSQCAECPVGKDACAPCPVLLAQLEHNYSQHDDKSGQVASLLNLLINKDGDCQMKPVMERAIFGPGYEGPKPVNVIPSMKNWAIQHGVKVRSAA